MSFAPIESYEKLLEVVRRIVKTMREDFATSREAEIVKDREEVYRTYYNVAPLGLSSQEKPVVFVDAGYYVAESDVASLIFVNIGCCVRDEEGKLRYASDLGDYPNAESYFIYGRWLEKRGEPHYHLQVVPLEESGLLLNEERAPKVSIELTEMVNSGFKRNLPRERAIRLFKRFVKYVESLFEVAYVVRLFKLVGSNSVGVVDGTLARWFGVKHIRFFEFEGLDILRVVTQSSIEQLKDILLSRVCGLAKTSKFTTIARARWLFKGGVSNPLGLYALTNSSLSEKAAKLIEERIKGKYGEEAARETTLLFNRIVHPKSGIWTARFPLTTDNIVVLHLEVYSAGPIIEYNDASGSVVAHPDRADEVGSRASYTVENIAAYRTNSHGLPPHGFMEVDEKVRVPRSFYSQLEEIFVRVIREETGEIGHPLEHLFGITKRMRLGYEYR